MKGLVFCNVYFKIIRMSSCIPVLIPNIIPVKTTVAITDVLKLINTSLNFGIVSCEISLLNLDFFLFEVFVVFFFFAIYNTPLCKQSFFLCIFSFFICRFRKQSIRNTSTCNICIKCFLCFDDNTNYDNE